MRSAARFQDPTGVAVDSAGNVYLADTGSHTIRKITPDGVASTLAGLAGNPGHLDGTGSAARFQDPTGVAVDNAGNVYVVETGESTSDSSTVRKITPDGVVSTLAGSALDGVGSADGTGSAARFYHPRGVAVDSAGILYVADTGNNTIRKITPDGLVSTPAGLAGSWGSADGTGSEARFGEPWGVALDNAGNVYVADNSNSMIRKITPDGVVSTLAGSALDGVNSADGRGSTARFNSPHGVAVDSAGNVYVADSNNHTIRKGVLSGGGSPNMPAEVVMVNRSGAEKIGAPREIRPTQINRTASAPILQFARENGTFRLSVSTSSSQTYVLEYKNSLTETEWKPLTSVPGDGAAKFLLDPSALAKQRFYRVRVE